MVTTEDPYEILGVNRNVTLDELSIAYKRLAKLSHSDHNGGSDAAMIRLNNARDEIEKELQARGDNGQAQKPDDDPDEQAYQRYRANRERQEQEWKDRVRREREARARQEEQARRESQWHDRYVKEKYGEQHPPKRRPKRKHETIRDALKEPDSSDHESVNLSDLSGWMSDNFGSGRRDGGSWWRS